MTFPTPESGGGEVSGASARSLGARQPVPLSCDCRSLADLENKSPLIWQTKSATFNSPFHELDQVHKRRRRSVYSKKTKDHVQRSFISSNKMSFLHENYSEEYPHINTSNLDNFTMNTGNLFKCIHNIIFKTNKTKGINLTSKLDKDNIYKFIIHIQLINKLMEKCKHEIEVTNINKEVNSGPTTQNNSIFIDFNSISYNLTNVTYNIRSETNQFIRTVITIYSKEVLTFLNSKDYFHSHSDILHNRRHSTVTIYPSTFPPASKYYDFAKKTVLMKNKTSNKILSPSKPITSIMKAVKDDVKILSGQKSITSSTQNKKNHMLSSNNYNYFNTTKKPIFIPTITEYSGKSNESFSIQNLDDKTEITNKTKLIPIVKNLNARSYNKVLKDITDIITKTNKVKDYGPNIDSTTRIKTVSNILPVKLLKSTITPLKTIKGSKIRANPIRNLSINTGNLKDVNKIFFRKTNLRPLYKESEIPIIRVISREYANNSVSSIINGTEILPNNDFKETSFHTYNAKNDFDPKTPKSNKNKMFNVTIPTATSKLITPKAIQKTSKDPNIYRKLYFINGHLKFSVRLLEEPDGSLQLGLDILHIRNKIGKENQSNLLPLLCNCIKLKSHIN